MITLNAIDDLIERCRRDVDDGLLPSCQFALAREGEVIINEAHGDADVNTRYVVFSATKPLVTGVVWQLIGEGTIDIRNRVTEYVPEFDSNGKDIITVEQLMLHTSGIPTAPLGPPEWSSSTSRRAAFTRWRLNSEPGVRYQYHPTSAHWALAEIIISATGSDYRDVLHERITQPLGLPRVLGTTCDIAPLELRGEPGVSDEPGSETGTSMVGGELSEITLLSFNSPQAREVGVPGGGGVMRASDLALYYQALLHNPSDLWDPAVLADATGHVRNYPPDPFTAAPANRTLGLVQAGSDGMSNVRGMGRTVSPRAFGHNGAAGHIAFADPETGLSFAYCTNGIDRNVLRQARRVTAIASRAGLC